MQPEDALPTIAEVAITIAGFTGIVIAFRPSGREWSEEESFRLRNSFVATAVILICAFLPFGLAGFSSSAAVVWGLPLCFYALASAGQTAWSARELARRSVHPTMPTLAYSLLAISGVLQTLSLLSGLGLVIPHSAGLLVFDLVFTLLGNAIALLLLVNFWVRPPAA